MNKGSTEKTTKRNSTIELLRIICMLLVIAHHCVVHGGALGMDLCANKYIATFILPVGKIAFTCFVAISMWFLVDQRFKASRFLRAWLEVLFYSVIMMFPSMMLGSQLAPADWVGAFLPIGGNSHGFAATYLLFYLFLPLLNRISASITKRQAVWTISILAYAQVGERMLAQFGISNLALHPFMSEVTLFALCFFVALYLKRWTPSIAKSAPIMGALAIFVWLFVAVAAVQSWRVGGAWVQISPLLAADESSLLYLVGGFALFLAFNALPEFYSRWINLIAGTTFGILLMHDHGFFRYVLWDTVVGASSWWYANDFLIRVVLWTLAIFVACSVADMLRRRCFEVPLMSTSLATRFVGGLQAVWDSSAIQGGGSMITRSQMDGHGVHFPHADEAIVHAEPSVAVVPHCCRRESVVRWGAIAVLGFSAIFFTVNFITRSGFLSSYFVGDWQDTFMDYFNMLEAVRKGDPYYADANYPAIVFLILKILFHFVPRNMLVAAGSPREEAFALRSLMPALIPFILFCLVCLLVIVLCIRYMLRSRDSLTVNLVVAAVLFSGPMLFLLERGNVLLLALAALMVFIAFYRSDNVRLRYCACVALALAASIKLYPAVFALLLLQRKAYREFACTVLVGLAFLILPFFVFNGVDSMMTMLYGITKSSGIVSTLGLGLNYSFSNLLSIAFSLLRIEKGVPGFVASVVPLLVSIVLFTLSRSEWERVFACALACIWVPSFSYTYGLTLLIPVLMVMVSDGAYSQRFARIAGVALLFLNVPLASPVLLEAKQYSLYWGCALGNAVLFLLVVFMFVQSYRSLRFSGQGEEKLVSHGQ